MSGDSNCTPMDLHLIDQAWRLQSQFGYNQSLHSPIHLTTPKTDENKFSPPLLSYTPLATDYIFIIQNAASHGTPCFPHSTKFLVFAALSISQLTKEEEGGNEDMEVRREDQEKINRFSSLHQKETALEEELRGKIVSSHFDHVGTARMESRGACLVQFK
jgi:hypothetical protein